MTEILRTAPLMVVLGIVAPGLFSCIFYYVRK